METVKARSGFSLASTNYTAIFAQKQEEQQKKAKKEAKAGGSKAPGRRQSREKESIGCLHEAGGCCIPRSA